MVGRIRIHANTLLLACAVCLAAPVLTSVAWAGSLQSGRLVRISGPSPFTACTADNVGGQPGQHAIQPAKKRISERRGRPRGFHRRGNGAGDHDIPLLQSFEHLGIGAVGNPHFHRDGLQHVF